MRHALCAMREVEVTMPAIASIEDFKAAQEELLEAKDLNELKAEVRLNELIRKNLAKLEVKE